MTDNPDIGSERVTQHMFEMLPQLLHPRLTRVLSETLNDEQKATLTAKVMVAINEVTDNEQG